MSTRHDHERNRTGRRAGLLLGLGLFLLAGTAGAVPQIESGYGAQNAFLLPEINGMGSTGAALYRGGLSGLLNPALLADERDYRFDAALGVDSRNEVRFQPLFDTFESYVADIAIASNRQTKVPTGFAFAARPGRGDWPIALSLSLADRYAFGYQFGEQIRDPDGSHDPRDQVLEERVYEVSGTLRNLSLGVAGDVGSRISLGAAMHYAFGPRDESAARRFYSYSEVDSSYAARHEWDLAGVNFTVGARVRAGDRFDVGLAYESRLTADGDYMVVEEQMESGTVEQTKEFSQQKLRYPGYFRGGVTFRPRTDPRTVFSVDLVYADWSKFEDSRVTDDDSGNLQEVWDVRIGAQHTFYNGMQMLFGFRRFDSYLDGDTGTSVFSGGVTTSLVGGRLAVSLEVSKLQSIQPHIFPYPDGVDGFGQPIGADPDARVEDSQLRLGVGYSYGF